MPNIHAVTGAFGYSGKYIARRLLDAGHQVLTLTNSPGRENPFGDRIRVSPLHFDRPGKLSESLEGVSVPLQHLLDSLQSPALYTFRSCSKYPDTFRSRKGRGSRESCAYQHHQSFDRLRSRIFRGKADLESALVETGMSYAILRPTVLFGKEDILINNIAWMLRRFPVFGVFGDGAYRLQPLYVDDLARLAVYQGGRTENSVLNAIGPETFTYRQLVRCHWPDYREAPSHYLHSACFGVFSGKSNRSDHGRRHCDASGNSGTDARPPLRGLSTRRQHSADRLGCRAQDDTGRPLRLRTGSPLSLINPLFTRPNLPSIQSSIVNRQSKYPLPDGRGSERCRFTQDFFYFW